MGGMQIVTEVGGDTPPAAAAQQHPSYDPPWRQYIPRPDPDHPGDWESVDDNKIVQFVKNFCDPKARGNLYRWWHLYRMARNEWAFRNRMWIAPYKDWYNVQQGFQFVELYRKSQASFPRPVDNRIKIGVNNEVSRLTADEYEPNVVGGEDSPGVDAAARAATEYLKLALKDQRWPAIRELWARKMILHGNGNTRSVIDRSTLAPMLRTSPDAAWCPSCSGVFASREIPSDFLDKFEVKQRGYMNSGRRPGHVAMTLCPLCDSPEPLQPYTPTLEEAQEEPDAFQRPLGLVVAKQRPLIENVSNFHLFIENGGRYVTPASSKIKGHVQPRSLDWIAEHHPEVADNVQSEQGWEMLRYHPVFGSNHFGVGWMANESLENHALVYEMEIQPVRGLEDGATFVVINDLVALKDDLYKKVNWGTDEKKNVLRVPRTHYAVARMEASEDDWWSTTPVDDAVPSNCSLNECLAQYNDLRERGYPRIFTKPGVEIREKARAGGTLTQVEIGGPDGDEIDVQKHMYISKLMAGDNYLSEIEYHIAAIEKKLGPKPIESGYNEKNIRTVRGMQLASSQAAKSREPTIRALEDGCNDLFTHFLHTTWALTLTGEGAIEYEQKTATGRRRMAEFKSHQVLGPGAVVEIEKATSTDESVYEAEAAGQYLTSGLVDPRTLSPTKRRTVAKMIGVPEALGEEENVQIDRAEDHWREFIQNGTIPVIDAAIDNAAIRYTVLANRWIGNEGMALQREIGWPDLLRAIAPWKEAVRSLEQRDQALMPYRSADPRMWPQIAAGLLQKYSVEASAAAAAGMPIPPKPLPPPPPTAELAPPLPALPQDRIAMAVLQLAEPALKKTSIEVDDPAHPSPQQKAAGALKFWSLIQAYHELATKQQIEAMAGAPAGAPSAGTGTGSQASSASEGV